MRRRKYFIIAVGSIIAVLEMQSSLLSQVPEIPRPFMGGIARATTNRSGQAVIYYNPRTIRRMGPQVSEFFRAHEYAHLRLNHLNRSISVQQAEAEADSFAARTASPAAVAAARHWFMRGNGGSRQHGSGMERANRLSGGGSFNHASASVRSRSNQVFSSSQRSNRFRLFRFRR